MDDKVNGCRREPPEIDYICDDCKDTFKAKQGSQRRLCPKGLVIAMTAPKPRAKGGE